MRQEEKHQAGTPVRNGRNWISRAGFACAVWGLVLAAGNAAGQSVPTVSVDDIHITQREGYTFVYTVTLDAPAPANGLTVNYTLTVQAGQTSRDFGAAQYLGNKSVFVQGGAVRTVIDINLPTSSGSSL